MSNKTIFKVILLAFICRGIYFVAVMKTDILKSPEKSISLVYQRSAYLLAWGYGYSQTLPGSKAYLEVENNKRSVYQGAKITHPYISDDGLYLTSHYPPGWSLTGAFLYRCLGVPVLESMIGLAILFDLISLYFFIKLLSNFLSKKMVFWSALLYSVFPPILFLQVNGSADSFMPGFIIIMSFLFYFSKKFNSWKKYGIWILIGLLTGISALYRSDYFLFPFFLSILMLAGDFKVFPFLKYNVTVGIIAVLVLLPWAIRNKTVDGRVNFTSTSLGGTLVTGLAAFPNPWKLGPTDFDRRKEAMEAGIATPFEENGNQFFLGKYKSYVSEHPGFFFKAVMYRTLYFLAGPYDWGFVKSKEFSFSAIRNKGNVFSKFGLILKEKFFNFLSVIFSLLSLFAVCILWKRPGNMRNFVGFCFITLGYVYLSHVFIHMTANYTIPVICVQIPLVILGILFLFSRKTFNKAVYENPGG